MPIDFAAIATAFSPPLRAELATMGLSFAVIGRWLAKLVEKTDAAERATRGLPDLRFISGAVTAWVDRSQVGALTPDRPPPNASDAFVAGVERFAGGLAYARQAVREANLLPDFVEALRRGSDLIDAAVARALRLDPADFDPRRARTASDVFGGLGLAAYAYYYPAADGRRGKDQIDEAMTTLRRVAALGSALPWGRLADPIRDAIQRARTALMPPTGPQATVGARPSLIPAPALTFAELLETVIRYTAGAILLLPLLPGLLLPILDRAIHAVKVGVLEELQAIEAKVLDVRRQVVDFFYTDLPAFGQRLFDTLAVVGPMLIGHVQFLSRFVVAYLHAAGGQVIDLLKRFVRFVGRLAVLGRLIGNIIDAVLDFDLKGAAIRASEHDVLIPALGGETLENFPSTLRELIQGMTSGNAGALRDRLLPGMSELAPGSWFGPSIIGRIRAYRQVITGLVRNVGFVPTPGFMPYTGPRFPDLYASFMGADGAARILGFIGTLGRTVRVRVDTALRRGVRAFDEAGLVLDAEADRAVRLGSQARFERVAAWATGLADEAFGGQLRDLRARVARGGGPMAAAFEAMLARGGLYLIGAVIPRYIEGLGDYARERRLRQAEGRFGPASSLPPYAVPTSPHLLDRRVRLGRVRMPRLTIRAGMHPLDDDLTTTVATRFKAEVETAYRLGLDRLPT